MKTYASLSEGHLRQRWVENDQGAEFDYGMPTIRPARETNRILAEFHASSYTSIRYGAKEMREGAMLYLRYLRYDDVYDWRFIPEEQKAHARIVLGRLARFLDRAPDGYYFTVGLEDDRGLEYETNTRFDYREDAQEYADDIGGYVEERMIIQTLNYPKEN